MGEKLVQDIELREVLLMESEMVNFLEDLGYVLLVDSQMIGCCQTGINSTRRGNWCRQWI